MRAVIFCHRWGWMDADNFTARNAESTKRILLVMLIASVIGTVMAVMVLLAYGWLPSFALFLLSLIAYALSRVFDLLAELVAIIGRGEQSRAVKEKKDG
jgi:hypothetical protein